MREEEEKADAGCVKTPTKTGQDQGNKADRKHQLRIKGHGEGRSEEEEKEGNVIKSNGGRQLGRRYLRRTKKRNMD